MVDTSWTCSISPHVPQHCATGSSEPANSPGRLCPGAGGPLRPAFFPHPQEGSAKGSALSASDFGALCFEEDGQEGEGRGGDRDPRLSVSSRAVGPARSLACDEPHLRRQASQLLRVVPFSPDSYDGTSDLATVESYDPVTNSWQPEVSMGTRRSCLGVAALHGLLYAAGGYDGASCLNR